MPGVMRTIFFKGARLSSHIKTSPFLVRRSPEEHRQAAVSVSAAATLSTWGLKSSGLCNPLPSHLCLKEFNPGTVYHHHGDTGS